MTMFARKDPEKLLNVQTEPPLRKTHQRAAKINLSVLSHVHHRNRTIEVITSARNRTIEAVAHIHAFIAFICFANLDFASIAFLSFVALLLFFEPLVTAD